VDGGGARPDRRPSALIRGSLLSPSPPAPVAVTLRHDVMPVSRSWARTWTFVLAQPSETFGRLVWYRMKRPSALTVGSVLSAPPCVLTSVVVRSTRLRTNTCLPPESGGNTRSVALDENTT